MKKRIALALLALVLGARCSAAADDTPAVQADPTTTTAAEVTTTTIDVACRAARLRWNQAQALSRFGSPQYQAAWNDWQAACP